MGTRYNRLTEAVLTCTHNLSFEQKYEKSKKKSTENCHFYSRKKYCMLHGRVFVMLLKTLSFLSCMLVIWCIYNYTFVPNVQS